MNVGTGKSRASHTLHKTLLEVRSEYFRGALGGSFIESATNEVNLPEDDPIGFRCFVDWAYSGRLTKRYPYDDLVSGWIVAGKLMCQDLQNRIINRLQSFDRGASELNIQLVASHCL